MSLIKSMEEVMTFEKVQEILSTIDRLDCKLQDNGAIYIFIKNKEKLGEVIQSENLTKPTFRDLLDTIFSVGYIYCGFIEVYGGVIQIIN